jgi:uroporphyrinogen-III synthase
MRSLIERQGATAAVVPSMREVPLEQNAATFEFAETLLAGRLDVVVFLTGVGAQLLLDVVQSRFGREKFLAALRSVSVVVRGPKPTAVLRGWDVPIAIRAPEPNTWRELVAAMAAAGAIDGKRIAIQEYGRANAELYNELRTRGATVQAVPIYRWALPADTQPLSAAIQETLDGRFDVLLFTSAHQLACVLELAESDGKREAWLEAAGRCVIGSIGPTASETIRECGLPVNVEANPTRMGQLVLQTLAAAPAILAARNSGS